MAQNSATQPTMPPEIAGKWECLYRLPLPTLLHVEYSVKRTKNKTQLRLQFHIIVSYSYYLTLLRNHKQYLENFTESVEWGVLTLDS